MRFSLTFINDHITEEPEYILGCVLLSIYQRKMS